MHWLCKKFQPTVYREDVGGDFTKLFKWEKKIACIGMKLDKCLKRI